MAKAQSVRKMLPSPSVWAVLFLVTVPVAILANSMIIEVPPTGADVFWWTQLALPVVGAVTGARWTAKTGRRRSAAGFGSAVLAATLTGALYLTLSLVTYRWAIPLPEPVGGEKFLSLPTATAGGALRYGLGLYGHDRPPGRSRYAAGAVFQYAVGAVLAVLGGYLIFRTTDIAVMHGLPAYRADYVSGSLPVQAPSATRYSIIRTDSKKKIPDCRITGPGITDEPATPLTVPINGSYDATSEIWVAVFSTPSAGSYTVTCNITEYSTQPLGRGVAPAIRTWPAPAIVLLGALPGLVIIGDAFAARRRRCRRQETDQSRQGTGQTSST